MRRKLLWTCGGLFLATCFIISIAYGPGLDLMRKHWGE